jgi:hypothetical protein
MAEFYLDQASVVGGATDRVSAAPQKTPALALPDRPSVAVLPFTNMRADPEKEFLCRWHCRRRDHGLVSLSLAFRHRSQLLLHLQKRSADVKAVGRVGVCYVRTLIGKETSEPRPFQGAENLRH